MKRIYSILIGLLLLTSLQGQILVHSNYSAPPTPPAGYCVDYQDVLTAFGTQPHDTIKTKQNAMVYSLDSAGYWDRMDVFYIFAAHEASTESLINWIAPGTCDADNVSATAWTIWEGYTGDGVADYISTNYNPSVNAVNISIDNFTAGIYLRINKQENPAVFGATSGGSYIYLVPRDVSDGLSGSINSAADIITPSSVNSSGLWLVTRTASNATAVYRNGGAFDSEADVSGVLVNQEITVLKRNGAATFSTNQVSIFFVMNGVVNATEAGKINVIIEKYMDSLGRGVE